MIKVTREDATTWLVHSLGMLAMMGAIGLLSTSYAAGYAFGLSIYFHKEAKENGTIEIWKWKTLDSVMDFVSPMVAGGIALRYIERIIS